MASVTVLTAARMLEIEASSVTSGLVDVNGNLLLSTRGGDEIEAGNVRGPEGVGPTGTVTMFAGATAPVGWLVCDGSELSRFVYPDLFSAIGTSYGPGDGINTFNLPNLQGRVPVGADPTQAEFDALGEAGGAKTHTLTANEMPAHTHTQDAHSHTQNAHTHTQNAHTHTQDAHGHTQNSHDHTQNSHDHSQVAHNHIEGFAGVNSGAAYGVTTAPTGNVNNQGGQSTANHAYVGSVAANNNTTTADNNVSTATNQTTTAVNDNTTATNQNTTATNQNTTATNQSTGGGAAHNNLQPYIVMNYIIKT